jgi:hypothetical protein
MAHATKRDVSRARHRAPIRAKTLKPPVEPTPELRPHERPTWRPAPRQSGIQLSERRPLFGGPDSANRFEETVTADRSKDPRRDD